MLDWLFGRRTRLEEERATYPSRRVPNPDTSPIPYPSDLDASPEVGLGEFDPKKVRRSTQRQQTPPDQMTLTALVAEWERLGGVYIEQVQYCHDMFDSLQTLREQIAVRVDHRDDELEAEHERNEQLRQRIGAKDGTPTNSPRTVVEAEGKVKSPAVSRGDIDAPGANPDPVVVHVEPITRGNANGSGRKFDLDGHGGKPLRNPQ